MGTSDKLGDQTQQVAEELNANRTELRACADLPHLYVLNKPQAARRKGASMGTTPGENPGSAAASSAVVSQGNLQEICGNHRDYPNQNKQKCLFRAGSSKRASHNHLRLSGTQT